MNVDLKIEPTDIPLLRFANNAKIMSKTKDKNWLGRLIDKKKIKDSLYSSEHKDIFKSQLFSMIDVMESMHPGNWDVHLHINSGSVKLSMGFVIRYPKITISNENGLSRELKELLIYLPLKYSPDEETLQVVGIHGLRGSLSSEEYTIGYMHSHLRARQNLNYVSSLTIAGDYSRFCLGNGDLASTLATLLIEHDPQEFELFLILINNLVGWESLAGGPHINLSQLVRNNTVRGYNPSDHYSYVFDAILNHAKRGNFKVDFYVENGKYKIKPNTKFEDVTRQIMIDFDSGSAEVVLCKKRPDGTYVNFKTENEINPGYSEPNLKDAEGNVPYTIVSGQKIEMRVSKPNNDVEQITPNINEFSLHPKTINHVISKLNDLYYKAAIKGSAIRAKYTRDNAGSLS